MGSGTPPALEDTTIWMSIFDEDGNAVHRIASRLGDIRSSRSVILRPGSYAVRVNATRPKETPTYQRRDFYRIQYIVEGDGISEPTGPEIIDAADDPFAPCDKISNDFCYPNDVMSSDPFIIANDDDFKPNKPIQIPDWVNANLWYWLPDWLG